MTIYEMFPLDFFEFCKANGVAEKIFRKLGECFEKRIAIDSLIHEKMLELFRLYLIVGGMPAAVQKYLDTNNLQDVLAVQKSIVHYFLVHQFFGQYLYRAKD